MKGDYEILVKGGADESALDKMDGELFKSDRERVRIEIRLDQCNGEIEELFREREAAQLAAERGKYETDAKALDEAREIEAKVQLLVAAAAVHSQRLDRMRKFAESAGVAQIPFRLSNVERRVTAIFNGGGSVNRVYEQPYEEILKGNIAAVEKQLKGNISTEPSDAASAAGQEWEAETAVN